MAERHRRFCLLSRSFLWYVLRLNGERLLLGCAQMKSIMDIMYCQTQRLFTMLSNRFTELYLWITSVNIVPQQYLCPRKMQLFMFCYHHYKWTILVIVQMI